MADRPQFEKTLILTLGQTLGYGFQLALPFFLSRTLAVEEFGTFRQIVLIQWFFLATAHLGMDNAIFNYINNHPGKHAIFSLNAMIVAFCVGLVSALGMAIFRDQIGALFNNPDLAQWLPYFGIYLVLGVSTQQLEAYLVSIEKYFLCSVATFTTIACNAIAVIVGFAVFESLAAVLVLWALLELIKFSLVLGYNLRSMRKQGQGIADLRHWLPIQLRFSLPLGMANVIGMILNLDRFVISFLYSVKQFTIYSVGCFDIPILPYLVNNVFDLMSIDMVKALKEGRGDDVLIFFREAMRKVAMLTFPVFIYLAFFAKDLITFVFTDTYADSAVYFQVYIATVVFFNINPDVIFRVYPATRLYLGLQMVVAFYTVGLVFAGAYFFTPIGGLIGAAIADFLTTAIKGRFAGKLMGARFIHYYPWREFLLTSLIGICAGFVAYSLTSYLGVEKLLALIVSFPVYMLIVAVAYKLLGLVRAAEQEYVLAMVAKLLRRA